jgi:hypothetical protein
MVGRRIPAICVRTELFPRTAGTKKRSHIEYAELIELQEQQQQHNQQQQQQQQQWRKARPSWISEAAWTDIDRHACDRPLAALMSAVRNGKCGSLKLDWMKRFDNEAWLIEEAMENNDPKAGFQRMQENGINDLRE